MIFITLGTTKFNFSRLAKVVNNFKSNEEVYIQAGETCGFIGKKNVTVKSLLSLSEFISYTKKARVVIIHGGEGSILTSLKYAKLSPIVVPRDPKYKEHVDSQQLSSAKKIERMNLATVVYNPDDILKIIPNYNKKKPSDVKLFLDSSSKTKIIEYLDKVVLNS